MKILVASALIAVMASSALAKVRIGLVLDKGGRDDKSFNSAAFVGATRAIKELKIKVKTVEATDSNSFEPMLREFAQLDFNPIIAIGFSQKEAVQKVAAQFPQKHFVIVDAEVHAPNVKSIMFAEHEGSYLVGAIAALTSKTHKIGFLGGMDIPLIRRFEMGYIAGAKKVVPSVQIVTNFVGVTGDAWNNPAKAKELALSQYESGVDIIFDAAGASNTGAFDAAEESKHLAIGVDSDQNWMKPGFILTSMLKRVDVAVYEVCKDAANGQFTAGTTFFGLANHGVDYAMDQYNQKLISPHVRKVVESLRAQILAKHIKVPDYYKIKAKK